MLVNKLSRAELRFIVGNSDGASKVSNRNLSSYILIDIWLG